MDKKKQQMAVLALLAIVMIVVYARALRRPSGTTSGSATHVAAGPSAAVPKPAERSAALLHDPMKAKMRGEQRQWLAGATWKRDPFTRGAQIGETGELKLSGILWDPNGPMAIINGEMHHAGELLEGYRIIEITQDHVSVSDGVDTFQLLIAP